MAAPWSGANASSVAADCGRGRVYLQIAWAKLETLAQGALLKPIWTKPGEGSSTYVWSCQACRDEFTCTAVHPHREAQPLAA